MSVDHTAIIGQTYHKSLHAKPKTYVGPRSFGALKQLQAERPALLVTESLANSEHVQKLSGVLGEPVVVEECSSEAIEDLATRLAGSDVVVAVGGGSVIDAAKIIRHLLGHPDDSPGSLTFDGKQSIALIAVPSTAATGSETSQVAVINDEDKRAVVDESLVPDIAVLDSQLLETLSRDLMITGCMDVIAHAYESAVSRIATPPVQEHSIAAFRLLEEAIPALGERDADQSLLYAAHFAGYAQSNAFVGPVHAAAHALESLTGNSHALCISYVLGPYLSWRSEQGDDPFIKQAVALIDSLNVQVEPLDVDVAQWAKRAAQDPSLKTSPIRLDEDGMREVLTWIQRSQAS